MSSREPEDPRRYLDIILRAKLLLSMQYLLIEAGTNTRIHRYTNTYAYTHTLGFFVKLIDNKGFGA